MNYEELGMLWVPEERTKSDKVLAKKKERAIQRLKSTGLEHELDYWVISSILDRRDEYLDSEGYTWGWDVVEESHLEYTPGIIVARKDLGEGVPGYKVWDLRKLVFKWEQETCEPYEPYSLAVYAF